jgi:CO/xanthine dehydrogenase Mo-binding subunit
MLYARLVRSPHAHAVIKKIDASRALELPGVQAVVTSADYPDVNDEIVPGITPLPRRFVIANFIAVDKALYHGHPVAAVCATSPHIAEDAIALIDVEYEVLPPVMSAQRAMEPDAPILHPALRTREPLTAVESTAADQETNVASHVQVANARGLGKTR